jgi:hypothetical protein
MCGANELKFCMEAQIQNKTPASAFTTMAIARIFEILYEKL